MEPVEGLEHLMYVFDHGFTLHYMLLLAPLRPEDSEDVVTVKLGLVGRFTDTLLAWRIWNWRSIAYSTMQYAMFLVMREIRGLEPVALAQKLHGLLSVSPRRSRPTTGCGCTSRIATPFTAYWRE